MMPLSAIGLLILRRQLAFMVLICTLFLLLECSSGMTSSVTPSPVTPSPVTPSLLSASTFMFTGDNTHTSKLDYISVAVICGVVAFCFLICLIVGCRRRKHRRRMPRCDDRTPTAVSQSVTDTDGPTMRATAGERANSIENSSGGPRNLESPPPTYSVIERQTSFSSYVSQTSSMIEVPPDYDDSWNPDNSVDTEISNVSTSSGRRVRSVRSGRSASSRGSRPQGPPRARSAYRSHSDADGARRVRRHGSTRPDTVSEDDVTSHVDPGNQSFEAIIEVNPSPRSSAIIDVPAADENAAVNESSQPLIVDRDIAGSRNKTAYSSAV